MAVLSTHVTKFSPLTIDPYHTLKGLSGLHWFGTDENGRDVLSRTLAGARSVLIIAPLSTLFCLFFGGAIGLVSGYYKGYTDEIIMRFVDVLLSLPVVVAAIVVVSAFQSHTQGSAAAQTAVVILVIGILFTPPVARTIRAAVVAEAEKEYVQAARLRGERTWYILAAEIMPNITSPLIVEGTVRLGYAVFTAATLVVPGLRRPAAVARLGPHDLARACQHPGRLVDRALPGARPRIAGRRRQPAGRRRAQGAVGVMGMPR